MASMFCDKRNGGSIILSYKKNDDLHENNETKILVDAKVVLPDDNNNTQMNKYLSEPKDPHSKVTKQCLFDADMKNVPQEKFCTRNKNRSHKSCNTRPQTTPHSSRRPPSAPSSAIDKDEIVKRQLKMQSWISKKSLQGLQERADKEAKETKSMYESLLSREEAFMREVSSYLYDKDICDLRKKEILHKKWTDRVHEPIRKRIIEELDSQGFAQHVEKKRELHRDYLQYLNKKGCAFLDTYPPDDYYPLGLISAKPCYAMLRMKRINDPLLSQQRARTAEERTILRCQTGTIYSDKDIAEVHLPQLPLVPLGRQGTGCTTWLTMPYTFIESPIRAGYSENSKREMNASHFSFQDWGEKVDQSVVDLELSFGRLKSGSARVKRLAAMEIKKRNSYIEPSSGVTDTPVTPQPVPVGV